MRRFFDYAFIPAALFILWLYTTTEGFVAPILLPSPASVAARFAGLIGNGELLHHIGASAFRTMTGFLLAASLGISLGVLCAKSPKASRLTRFLIEALRVTPPLSLIPLLILWLGIEEAPKIAIVFLSGFFPIYMNAATAVAGVDPKLIEAARTLKFTGRELFFKLTLPAALPGIVTGLRLGFGYCWRALVGAELIAASSGLGFLISESGEFAKTDAVFVGIITIVVLGIAADALLRALLKRVTPASVAEVQRV